MSREIGHRVGAILSMNETHVRLIGYGTYQGEHTPPDDIGGFIIGRTNPKLVMDDGTVVWGCECWWGPEKKMRKRIAGLAVIPVNMADERQRYALTGGSDQ
jgi:hypothetical protein